ncbi:MAG: two-component system response regulator [Candidatus Angelobacter sp. Gp1-AA117]|nr:MAG: two-component system response regulator [Candidatus Angelobacter sp. Gp1-AA117]
MVKTRTILMVEDDPADMRLIQRAFAKAEITAKVIRLTNGDDAVAYLDGQAPYDNRAAYPLPNLLILDLKLPRRNGFEVLQWLRSRRDGIRRMPVIMLTSSRHTVDINRAYDSGVNSYLAKPENTEGLLQVANAIKTYWLSLNEDPTLLGTGTYGK